MKYQPRYIAYYLAHAASSGEEMLERDRATWPGGHMCGFMLWVHSKWHEWEKATAWRGAFHTAHDHAAFDVWILADTLRRIYLRDTLKRIA